MIVSDFYFIATITLEYDGYLTIVVANVIGSTALLVSHRRKSFMLLKHASELYGAALT